MCTYYLFIAARSFHWRRCCLCVGSLRSDNVNSPAAGLMKQYLTTSCLILERFLIPFSVCVVSLQNWSCSRADSESLPGSTWWNKKKSQSFFALLPQFLICLSIVFLSCRVWLQCGLRGFPSRVMWSRWRLHSRATSWSNLHMPGCPGS